MKKKTVLQIDVERVKEMLLDKLPGVSVNAYDGDEIRKSIELAFGYLTTSNALSDYLSEFFQGNYPDIQVDIVSFDDSDGLQGTAQFSWVGKKETMDFFIDSLDIKWFDMLPGTSRGGWFLYQPPTLFFDDSSRLMHFDKYEAYYKELLISAIEQYTDKILLRQYLTGVDAKEVKPYIEPLAFGKTLKESYAKQHVYNLLVERDPSLKEFFDPEDLMEKILINSHRAVNPERIVEQALAILSEDGEMEVEISKCDDEPFSGKANIMYGQYSGEVSFFYNKEDMGYYILKDDDTEDRLLIELNKPMHIIHEKTSPFCNAPCFRSDIEDGIRMGVNALKGWMYEINYELEDE